MNGCSHFKYEAAAVATVIDKFSTTEKVFICVGVESRNRGSWLVALPKEMVMVESRGMGGSLPLLRTYLN